MAESGNDIVEFTQDGNTRWAARDSKAYQRYLKEQKQAGTQEPQQAQQAPQTEQPSAAQVPSQPPPVVETPQTQPPQAQVPPPQTGGKPKA